MPMKPRTGMVWRTDDGVTLRFIGPSLHKHFRMLFADDAGSTAEQRFLNEGVDLHADVPLCF